MESFPQFSEKFCWGGGYSIDRQIFVISKRIREFSDSSARADSPSGNWCSAADFIRSNFFPGWCDTEPTKSWKINCALLIQFLPRASSSTTDGFSQED
jgi:hypothetical protein